MGSSKYFKVQANAKSLSGGSIVSLPAIGLKELKSIIFVPDGDIPTTKKYPNLVSLPGKESPEWLIYDFLNKLDESDPFWGKSGNGYSPQVAFRKYWNISKTIGKEQLKAWYRSQKKYWKSELDVFKCWTKGQSNQTECRRFCKDLAKAVRCVAPGIIPEDPLKELENRFSILESND